MHASCGTVAGERKPEPNGPLVRPLGPARRWSLQELAARLLAALPEKMVNLVAQGVVRPHGSPPRGRAQSQTGTGTGCMHERRVLTCNQRLTGGGRGQMCALLILGKLAFNEERHPPGKLGGGGGGQKQQKSFNTAAPREGWNAKKTVP